MNRPDDPRYDANVYVPKLTEAQRQARATPLENLRSLRFRSQAPAAEVEQPAPQEVIADDIVRSVAVPESHPDTVPELPPVTIPALWNSEANRAHISEYATQRGLDIHVQMNIAE